jgi:xanthine dehydrogenase YagR molybdenum-binding subunit
MSKINRRNFLKGASVAVGSTSLAANAQSDAGVAEETPGLEKPTEETIIDSRESRDSLSVALQINGSTKQCQVKIETTLADAIREKAGLTGTKVCCGGGACGACTVHIDGKPTSSCLTLAMDAEGHQITTIEGLANAKGLHPVQQAFIDADALQCGFCTPGMIMSAVAFCDQWQKNGGGATRPSATAVKEAMAGNLCRCGAQPGIINAIQAACAGEKARPPGENFKEAAISRVDGEEKVRGEAKYTIDHYPEGMLYGYILRSPHASAVVKNMDLSAAKHLPGVKAVIKLLPSETIRYHHQAIAAVAAKTYAQAKKAAAQIGVSYEVKQSVTSLKQATAPNAPLVYAETARDEVGSASEGPGAPAFLFQWEGNRRVSRQLPLLDNGSGAMELIREQKYQSAFYGSTETQVHATLERHCCVAEWGKSEAGAETLTMHATTQTVQILQGDLAEAFDIPSAQVQVKSAYVGGGFGSKAGLRVEHLAAGRLAKQTGAPVRIVLPFDSHLVVGGNRPGTHHQLTVGANSKGELKGIHHRAINLCGTAVGEKSTGMSGIHYDYEKSYTDDESVVTHSAPGCPLRAPGHPPNAFALEQAVDDIAVQIDQDPLQMRIDQDKMERRRLVYSLAKRNIRNPDRLKKVNSSNAVRKSTGRWLEGVGVATAEWFVLTSPSCQVEIRAYRDGHIEVNSATHDMGQGSRTVLAQVMLETLNVPPERIIVKVGDSALPSAPGTFGSITTGSIAPAAQRAALDLKNVLISAASRKVPSSTADAWGIKDGDGELHRVRDLFQYLPTDPYTVVGQRGADKDGFQYMPKALNLLTKHSPFAIGKDVVSSAHVAEVVVDRHLGRIHVPKMTVALDAGKIASPVTARSQVIGAALQGISYALYENRRLDPKSGRQLATSFETYAILGIADTPEVDVHFLDRPSPNNPYGSLGLGENATIAASAAVANGFFRATGKRIKESPLTPDKVLKALAG